MYRKNYFYFRSTATLGDDDNFSDSLTIDVDDITGMIQVDDLTLNIYHENHSSGGGGLPLRCQDILQLNVKSGTRKEVLKTLAAAANGPTHHDGITIVADDVTGTYLTSDITGCNIVGATDDGQAIS